MANSSSTDGVDTLHPQGVLGFQRSRPKGSWLDLGRRQFISPEDADVLTIGCSAMLLSTIRNEFRNPHWVVVSARSLEEGLAYLRYNTAGVVVADAASVECDWRHVVSSVKGLSNGPDVIVAASTAEQAGEALRLGAYDVIERSLDASDVLWTLASAWHHSMRSRGEITLGGYLCSDA